MLSVPDPPSFLSMGPLPSASQVRLSVFLTVLPRVDRYIALLTQSPLRRLRSASSPCSLFSEELGAEDLQLFFDSRVFFHLVLLACPHFGFPRDDSPLPLLHSRFPPCQTIMSQKECASVFLLRSFPLSPFRSLLSLLTRHMFLISYRSRSVFDRGRKESPSVILHSVLVLMGQKRVAKPPSSL